MSASLWRECWNTGECWGKKLTIGVCTCGGSALWKLVSVQGWTTYGHGGSFAPSHLTCRHMTCHVGRGRSSSVVSIICRCRRRCSCCRNVSVSSSWRRGWQVPITRDAWWGKDNTHLSISNVNQICMLWLMPATLKYSSQCRHCCLDIRDTKTAGTTFLWTLNCQTRLCFIF